MGLNLYPRVPDLRAPSIIENGVSLTGMPTWRNAQRESSGAILECGRLHSQPASADADRILPAGKSTHHRAGSPGSESAACHMPKIETEGVPGAYVPRGEIDGVGRGGDEPLAGVSPWKIR